MGKNCDKVVSGAYGVAKCLARTRITSQCKYRKGSNPFRSAIEEPPWTKIFRPRGFSFKIYLQQRKEQSLTQPASSCA